MNKKYLAIVLIIIGAALMAWGYSVYDSAGSQISRAISGDTPIEAWIGMVGGAISLLIGIVKLK